MYYVLVLLMSIVLCFFFLSLWECIYPSFYIQRDEVTRRVTELVTT
jgi:hypothetical protein